MDGEARKLMISIASFQMTLEEYRELPTPNQRLWCWLPVSTAFAITEDINLLIGLTLPPLAVASVPEAENCSQITNFFDYLVFVISEDFV
jgi:hypothetical protein